MSGIKQLLTMMTKYHVWAYRQLFTSLERVPNEEYFNPRLKLFFGSIHGTVNHLCLVDRLWHGRFVNKPFVIRSLDQELYQDRDELREAVLEGATQWESYVENATLEELNTEQEYTNTKGSVSRFLPATTILHVVNHGTHHRGQITTALNVLDRTAEPMDLFYCPAYRDTNFITQMDSVLFKPEQSTQEQKEQENHLINSPKASL